MDGFTPLDGAVGVVLLAAMARGLLRGLIREAVSLAALAGAVVVVRLWNRPVADWLLAKSDGAVGDAVAPWLAGFLLVVTTIAVAGFGARLLRRGARQAGLGLVDRLGGGALGAAEGALVAAVLLVGASWLVGPDHPSLSASRSYPAFQRLQTAVRENAPPLPQVASPPQRDSASARPKSR
ncbi:MAG: CvpA family protein [Proteobacteria bacterium]|nr:CvpA family protein [Pseudomonadota bacterium]